MTPEEIQTEHDRLGYAAGWRFLTGPARNVASAKVAIVTLNPGGARNLERGHAERWSNEAGSAYRLESWGGQPSGADPLQLQVQRLCRLLAIQPDDALSGHFVPFRSPDWQALQRRDEAAAFGLRLWRWVLSQSPAEIIVCVGKHVAGAGIASILNARPDAATRTGWGETTADRYVAPDGRRIVALPHLGRFRLFGVPHRDALFLEALKF